MHTSNKSIFKPKTHLLFTAIAIAVMVSFAMVTPALADEPPPPPTPTEEPNTPPIKEPSNGDQIVDVTTSSSPNADASTATAQNISDQNGIADASSAHPYSDNQPGSQAASSDPDTSSPAILVIVDGQIEPLATQQAANIIANTDPMWCPSVITTDIGTDCVSSATVGGLLPQLSSKSGPGTIFFMPTYTVNDVVFDQLNDSNLANLTALTLQGGWDGNLTPTITSPLVSGNTTFTVPIAVINWSYAVTLNDIIVDGATDTGILVITSGDINLNAVSAANNGNAANENGATLDNTSGTGDVNVSGTNVFNNNFGSGLAVTSNGDVSINNVTAGISSATGNDGGYGVYINNSGGTGNVTLTGANTFSYNSKDGLHVDSKGDINIASITANNNGVLSSAGNGAYLNNSTGTGNIIIHGTNKFNDNYDNGLYIISKGSITGASSPSISAGNNLHGYGAYLNNLGGTGVDLSSATANVFSSNYFSGLLITSAGTISVNNVTANNNGMSGFGNGAQLDNSSGTSNIVIGGTNTFNTNHNNGLYLLSKGDITSSSPSSITASSNSFGYGALLDNSTGINKVVNLNNSTSNNFSGNYLSGIKIISSSSITINNTNASNNGNFGNAGAGDNGYGADLNGIGNVIVNNSAAGNAFNDNYFTGLKISSAADITISDVQANGNGHIGISPNTNPLKGYGAYLNSLTGNITVGGTANQFNNNYSTGLPIVTSGTVSISNVTASNNGILLLDPAYGYGASIDNSSGSSNVTISGTNTFNANYLTGLYVTSKGDVTFSAAATSISASNSATGYGAYISNIGGSGVVTLHNANSATFGLFSGNYLTGLYVQSKNAITVKRVTASNNGTNGNNGAGNNGYGAYIDNCVDTGAGCTGSGAVIVNSSGAAGSALNSNYFTGLQINSSGNITINRVVADGNGHVGISPNTNPQKGYGAYLNSPTGNITVGGTNNSFSNNYSTGLPIVTSGTVSISNVTANTNGTFLANPLYGYGVSIDNTSGTNNVTISATNTFNGNYLTGLYVTSKGDVAFPATATSITASNSATGYGAYISNIGGSGVVTLSNANNFTFGLFSGNFLSGLYVQSKNAITVKRVTASNNGTNGNSGAGNNGYGAYIDNCIDTGSGCTGSGAVIVNSSTTAGSTLSGNYYSGLQVNSGGNITINRVVADGNGHNGAIPNTDPTKGYGAYLNSPTGSITVGDTNNSFSNNYSTGLPIVTSGIVSIQNVTANNNGNTLLNPGYGFGAYIDNTSGTNDVILAGANTFNGNYLTGLKILSRGTVNGNTLSSLSASNNGNSGNNGLNDNGYGAFIDNASGVLKDVLLTNTSGSTLNNNYYTGLQVNSSGNITIANVTANNNGTGGNTVPQKGYGAYLNSLTGNITVAGSANSFSNNYSTGLPIVTSGIVSIQNVTANNNGNTLLNPGYGFGAYIDNTTSATNAAVSVLGTNVFSNNYLTGLYILSDGVVTLNNVSASTNGALSDNGYGAYIDNTTGTNDVILTGANTFDTNYLTGLKVLSHGTVNGSGLTSLSASNNGNSGNNGANDNGYGAFIDNAGGVLKDVLLNNTSGSTMSNNYYTGLQVNSSGNITIANVTANNNGTGGNTVPQKGYGAYLNSPTGNITVGGTNNSFSNNYSTGLPIVTSGIVSIQNVTANNNGNTLLNPGYGFGAYIDNTSGTNDVILTGANTFNGNYLTGLKILSRGTVNGNTLSSLSASNNGISGNNGLNDNGYGTFIDNASGVLKDVLLTNTSGSTLNNNYYTGLQVNSSGNITIANVTANNNGTSGNTVPQKGYGAYLNSSAGNITVAGSANSFSNNYSTGLPIVTSGIVSIQNVTANNNGTTLLNPGFGFGAYIDNTTSATNAAVSVLGTNVFSNNYLTGLYILSDGVVTLNNVSASTNGALSGNGFGAYIDNTTGTNDVILTGANTFDTNYLTGLKILSHGTVNGSGLTSLSASNNGNSGNNGANDNGYGAFIDNASGVLKDVLLTNTSGSTMSNNYYTGLQVNSSGNITIANVTANNNGTSGNTVPQKGYGAYLNSLTGNITVGGSANSFSGNYSTGLPITTSGTVSISNVTASNNGKVLVDPLYGFGAYIDNTSGTNDVILTGANTFDGNYLTGLVIKSKGTVNGNTLSSLSASNNGISGNNGLNDNGYGTFIDNASGVLKDVLLTNTSGSTLNNNYYTGLQVNSSGNITIANVTANNNGTSGNTVPQKGYGAYLNSSAGNITVAGSANSFSNNYSTGLPIVTSGIVSIQNVTANNNGTTLLNPGFGFGAYIDNTTSATNAAVSVLGTNVFSNNYLTGLYILSDGVVTLNNVSASTNGALSGNGFGAYIDNTTGTNDVILTGANTFDTNYLTGLKILSHGTVNGSGLTSLSASNNGNSGNNGANDNGYGAFIDNASGVLKDVLLTNTSGSTMSNNYYTGLQVNSSGNITIANVTANNNGTSGNTVPQKGYGAYLNSLTGNITVGGSANSFSGNYSTGLPITTSGTVSISNVTASNNGKVLVDPLYGFGAYIDNTSGTNDVILTGANTFDGNYLTGLVIKSKGTVNGNTLSSLSASNNGISGNNGLNDNGYGTFIDNASGVLKDVLLTNTSGSTLNNNYYTGLQVNSSGNITIANVTANNNGTSGNTVPQKGYGAYLNSSAGNITVAGSANSFSNNYSTGLPIVTSGIVSIQNVTANNNGTTLLNPGFGFGAYIDNTTSATNAAVSVLGTNVFSNNYLTGLYILSDGVVTLNNVSASTNGALSDNGFGAYIDNTTGTNDVILTGANTFDTNYLTGLKILSHGTVNGSGLTSLSASNNGNSGNNGANDNGYGAFIDNAGGVLKDVLLTNTSGSTMSNNYYTGLQVNSSGNITIANVTANNNGTGGNTVPQKGYGAYLNSPTGNITVGGTNNSFSNNYSTGLPIVTSGTVSIQNVTANNNGTTLLNPGFGFGAYIDNTTSATNAAVSVLGTNVFSNNYLTGLYILSDGVVTLNNVSASTNGALSDNGYGAYVDNSTGTGNVTLTGDNFFNFNDLTGLQVNTNGDFSANSVTANSNGLANVSGNGYGFDINTTNGDVTITGSNSFSNNYSTGLNIITAGVIDLTNIIASNNGSDNAHGAYLDNSTGSNPVTLNGTNIFNDNYLSGLFIQSQGAVTTTNVTANDNGGFGTYINNTFSSTNSAVIMNGANTTNGNVLDGLYVITNGNITIGSITANNNQGAGAALDNSSASGAISIAGPIVVDNNTLDGLNIKTTTDLTLSDVTATNNGNNGALIDAGTGVVTITGANVFNGNAYDGLNIVNSGSFSAPGSSSFSNNSGNGAHIISAGAISLANIIANTNMGGSGLLLSAGGAIDITGTNSANGNLLNGIDASSMSGDINIYNTNANSNSQNGFNLLTLNGTASLYCGAAMNNGGYGVNAILSILPLNLYGMVIGGNGWGDTNLRRNEIKSVQCDGSPYPRPPGGPSGKPPTELSIHILLVDSLDIAELNCDLYNGTLLTLINGDYALIPCPIGDQARLSALRTLNGLKSLPKGMTFGSGINLQIGSDAQKLVGHASASISVGEKMTIGFAIPQKMAGKQLSILFWDGKGWTELSGTYMPDGTFATQVDFTGVFILVAK